MMRVAGRPSIEASTSSRRGGKNVYFFRVASRARSIVCGVDVDRVDVLSAILTANARV